MLSRKRRKGGTTGTVGVTRSETLATDIVRQVDRVLTSFFENLVQEAAEDQNNVTPHHLKAFLTPRSRRGSRLRARSAVASSSTGSRSSSSNNNNNTTQGPGSGWLAGNEERLTELTNLQAVTQQLFAIVGKNPRSLHRLLPAGGLVSVLYHFGTTLEMTSRAVTRLKEQTSLSMWSVADGRVLGRFATYALGLFAWTQMRQARQRLRVERELRDCHDQLLLLLRTWLLATAIMKQTNLNSRKSYASLVRLPFDEDYLDRHKPSAQLLLETTTIPSAASMWFHGSLRLVAVKRGLDVMYSAFAAAFEDGRIVPWKAAPAFIYYALRPSVASERCSSLLQKADVDFIKTVWRLLDSYLSRTLLLLLPRLTTMKAVRVAGVSCHAFASFSLPGGFFATKRAAAAPAVSKCLLYIHGGGFIGSVWTAQIVFIDYSLAPESRFPVALDECTKVYAWLQARCASITVMGESAGGNLTAAMSIKLQRDNLPNPNAIVLVYPALNLNSTPSPSRFLHLSDPLVPTAALLPTCARAYVPHHLQDRAIRDPLMCPLFASDEELARLPTTFICTGGCDPLLDDMVEFDTRLRRQNVPGELRVHRELPHGFFMLQQFLPTAKPAIEGIFQRMLQSLEE